jgi:hypothetical protein
MFGVVVCWYYGLVRRRVSVAGGWFVREESRRLSFFPPLPFLPLSPMSMWQALSPSSDDSAPVFSPSLQRRGVCSGSLPSIPSPITSHTLQHYSTLNTPHQNKTSCFPPFRTYSRETTDPFTASSHPHQLTEKVWNGSPTHTHTQTWHTLHFLLEDAYAYLSNLELARVLLLGMHGMYVCRYMYVLCHLLLVRCKKNPAGFSLSLLSLIIRDGILTY